MSDTQKPTFGIWWTNQRDAEINEAYEDRLPEYLLSQFHSRLGRAGRGRLWVAPDIDIQDIAWPENSPLADSAMECGGIVFRLEDLATVKAMAGFCTDLEFNPL